jgi:homogentisate phytyltransferase/homogentisate geranylgeranyltransferase
LVTISGDSAICDGQVVGSGSMALLLGMLSGSAPLLATLVGSLLLGIAYSTDVPFLRWKQYPLAAATCILSVR